MNPDVLWYLKMAFLALIVVAMVVWLWREVKKDDAAIEKAEIERDAEWDDWCLSSARKNFINRPPPDSAVARKATDLGLRDSDDDRAFLLDDTEQPHPPRAA